MKLFATKAKNVLYNSEPPSLRDYANQHRERWDRLKVIVKTKAFMANPMILCQRSGFFDELITDEALSQHCIEVDLKEIDVVTFEILLNFLYTNVLDVNCDNVCDLLIASDLLMIEETKNHCITFLMEVLTPKNYFTVARIARASNSAELMQFTDDFFINNFAQIAATIEFKQLLMEDVISVLTEKNCHEKIFLAIVSWVKYDLPQRRGLFVDLFKLVNFEQMSPSFIQNVVAAEELVRTELGPFVWQLVQVMKISNPSVMSQSSQVQTGDDEECVRICIIGGTSTKSEFSLLDLKTRKCSYAMELPFEHVGGSSLEDGGKIFIYGGGDPPSTQSHAVVRSTDGFKCNKIRRMSKPRCYSGIAEVDGHIYMCGGWNRGRHVSACEDYSIANNTWNFIPSMITTRWGHGVVSCDGYVFCIGGYGGSQYLRSVERYEPGQRKWVQVEPMIRIRSLFAAAVVGSDIYVMGGTDGNVTLRSVEKYSNGVWSLVSPMSKARKDHAACVVDDRIFIVGGNGKYGSGCESSAEVYDPGKDKWEVFCQLERRYAGHSVVALE